MNLCIADQVYSSGKVRRWHTHPLLSQTQADHSWGVAMILLLLHPHPSADLLKEALMHDMHELVTGDVPSQCKSASYRTLEEGQKSLFRERNGLPVVNLSEEDAAWLKMADVLEAQLFLKLMSSADSMAMDAGQRLQALIDERRQALEGHAHLPLFAFAAGASA